MKRAVYLALCLTILSLSAPTLTFANVTFKSEAGLPLTVLVADCTTQAQPLTTCNNNPIGTSVAITQDTATGSGPNDYPWATPPAGASWISDADSGWNGQDFQPSNFGSQIFNLTETFTVVSGTATLALQVWADDSAGVVLSGPGITPAVGVLATATTNQGQPDCSGQIIACSSGQGLVASVTNLGVGTYNLTFTPWQTGPGPDTNSNPFGLLFTGTVTGDVSMPEAGTLLLLAFMGLIMFAVTKLLWKQA